MLTALIVEDDLEQADLVARLLRHRQIEPFTAHTGEDGLRLAREVDPDVILLDLMLPDSDGFQICQRLRADRETMRTPIVMLTALDGAKHRAMGFRVGANAYLTKPYAAADLFRAIDLAREWRDHLDRNQIAGEIHVEMHSESTLLQQVNDFLTSLSLGTPLTTDQVMQLRQAIMEMGQNAIEWGNRHNADALVTFVYRVLAEGVEIVVRDQGPGFDRTNLPHAATPEDPLSHLDVREKLGLRDGGFGLLICQGMLDELRFNDLGNEVTLIKRFKLDEATSSPPLS